MKRTANRKLLAIIRKIMMATLYPVRKCKLFFVFSWLMCWAISFTANAHDIEDSFFLTFILSLFDCYLLCSICSILKKIGIGWIVSLFTFAILFSELFVIFFNHSFLNRMAIQLILETDAREGSEFVRSVLFSSNAFYSLLISALVFVIAYTIVKLLVQLTTIKSFFLRISSECRICHNNNHESFIKTLNNRLLLYPQRYEKVFYSILFILIIWSGIRQVKSYHRVYICFTLERSYQCEEPENLPRLSTPFVRLMYGIAYNYVISNAELRALEKTISETTIDSCSYQCPLIVLIIGESYNKHHCYLYNKNHVKNTPRLQTKCDAGNLVPYQDVVAPFNHTAEVFRYMFSTWDDTCADRWADHTLFTAVFKKAGYNVFFVTNQFTMNAVDKFDVYGGTIFNHKQLSDQQFTWRNTERHFYDGELLSDIPDLKTLTESPTLLIVHLIGQHVAYCDRYPLDFEHFKSNEFVASFGGGDREIEMKKDYENSVYYNDFVVDSIFNMFQNTDAISLYFPDHGEEVYDWRNEFMRTDEPTLTPEVCHYQYEIPFMFYMTNSFMQKHQDIVQEVKGSKDRPFILTDLPHLMFHLGGIKMRDYKEEKDLLSPRYDIGRKRFVRSSYDYDELMGKWHDQEIVE